MNLMRLSRVLCILTAGVMSAQTIYLEKVARAKQLYQAGNYADAVKESLAATIQDPAGWEAYLIAGSAYGKQKLYDDALGSLQIALARAPEDLKPRIREALATLRTEQAGAGAKPLTANGSQPKQPEQADMTVEQALKKMQGETWTKPNSGLTWTRGAMPNKNFEEAAAYCRSLGAAWRPPKTAELASIYSVVMATTGGSQFEIGDTIRKLVDASDVQRGPTFQILLVNGVVWGTEESGEPGIVGFGKNAAILVKPHEGGARKVDALCVRPGAL